jgi:hypothetical protein
MMAAAASLLQACGSSEAPTAPTGGVAPPTYQFGAKFEPPVGRVVHAVGQWESYNAKYYAALPATMQPASQLIFITLENDPHPWNLNPRPWDPQKIALDIQTIWAAGRIPSLDLALRGDKPSTPELQQIPDPLYGIDDDVANTTQYDGRINEVVQLLKTFGKPVFLRIGGEFNGSWNGYHPFEYPKAFRKIVGMFRAAGVNNVAFVWCYEPAAPGDFDAVNGVGDPKWYPGADVVDWFSIDLFATADVSGSTAGAYGRTLKFLDMAVATARPVVIAESSPAHFDLGSALDAQSAWTQWFTPYLDLIAQRPEIKWFHLITFDWSGTSNFDGQGKNNDITVSPFVLGQWQAELAKPKYLHAGEQNLLKDWPTPP